MKLVSMVTNTCITSAHLPSLLLYNYAITHIFQIAILPLQHLITMQNDGILYDSETELFYE